MKPLSRSFAAAAAVRGNVKGCSSFGACDYIPSAHMLVLVQPRNSASSTPSSSSSGVSNCFLATSQATKVVINSVIEIQTGWRRRKCRFPCCTVQKQQFTCFTSTKVTSQRHRNPDRRRGGGGNAQSQCRCRFWHALDG
jgi:hypothetical protein